MQADPTSDSVALPASSKLYPTDANLLVIESVGGSVPRRLAAARRAGGWPSHPSAVPVPKLTSGPAGRYFVVPFVRTDRPDGCERIHWGSPAIRSRSPPRSIRKPRARR